MSKRPKPIKVKEIEPECLYDGANCNCIRRIEDIDTLIDRLFSAINLSRIQEKYGLKDTKKEREGWIKRVVPLAETRLEELREDYKAAGERERARIMKRGKELKERLERL